MVGTGGSDMMLAGLAMLCAHAMFKAALFMVVGIIDHRHRLPRHPAPRQGRAPLQRPCWSSPRAPPRAWPAPLPFFGFVAKEADLGDRRTAPALGAAAPWVLTGIVVGSVFTTIYSLRFMWGAFADKGLPETEHPGR